MWVVRRRQHIDGQSRSIARVLNLGELGGTLLVLLDLPQEHCVHGSLEDREERVLGIDCLKLGEMFYDEFLCPQVSRSAVLPRAGMNVTYLRSLPCCLKESLLTRLLDRSRFGKRAKLSHPEACCGRSPGRPLQRHLHHQ